MKQILKLGLLLPVVILTFVSCSTMKQSITKNNKSTDNLVLSLLEENGNAFYLSSTYATFSTVWTYKRNRIEVYKLVKGKISDKMSYQSGGFSNYEIPNNKELENETRECGYELDGDIFGFKIKNELEVNQQDLPISIECLKKLKYNSEFLNKVVDDINTYKMWDVKYN